MFGRKHERRRDVGHCAGGMSAIVPAGCRPLPLCEALRTSPGPEVGPTGVPFGGGRPLSAAGSLLRGACLAARLCRHERSPALRTVTAERTRYGAVERT